MNFKLKTGIQIQELLEKAIRINHRLVPFVPNGRMLALDLKRAGCQPMVIFDVGANIGQTATCFADHFPGSAIYSFEPVEETFKLLQKKVTGSAQIHCFQLGLGARSGTRSMYTCRDYNGLATLQHQAVSDSHFDRMEQVIITTGAEFCDAQQISAIDLLKIDVEGHELAVLEGFGARLRNDVKMIYAETGFDRADAYKTYFPDLLEACAAQGFVTAGFYEPFRWGKGKMNVFYNVLLYNSALVDV
jgi:FkbM family methyltransferase